MLLYSIYSDDMNVAMGGDFTRLRSTHSSDLISFVDIFD